METNEKVKLKLNKPHMKKNVGDVVEVRPMQARILKAIGVAEDYAVPPRAARATNTRVMQPEANVAKPETTETETTTEEKTETAEVGSPPKSTTFGRAPYSRRDMTPEE